MPHLNAPPLVSCRRLVGKCAFHLGEYQQAELAYRRAAAARPELPGAWRGLAELAAATGSPALLAEASAKLVRGQRHRAASQVARLPAIQPARLPACLLSRALATPRRAPRPCSSSSCPRTTRSAGKPAAPWPTPSAARATCPAPSARCARCCCCPAAPSLSGRRRGWTCSAGWQTCRYVRVRVYVPPGIGGVGGRLCGGGVVGQRSALEPASGARHSAACEPTPTPTGHVHPAVADAPALAPPAPHS
jgi:hypothetical protein